MKRLYLLKLRGSNRAFITSSKNNFSFIVASIYGEYIDTYGEKALDKLRDDGIFDKDENFTNNKCMQVTELKQVKGLVNEIDLDKYIDATGDTQMYNLLT